MQADLAVVAVLSWWVGGERNLQGEKKKKKKKKKKNTKKKKEKLTRGIFLYLVGGLEIGASFFSKNTTSSEGCEKQKISQV